MNTVMTYAQFANRVFGYTENGVFKVVDTATNEIVYSHPDKPYSTPDGCDSFYRALHKVKFSAEINN